MPQNRRLYAIVSFASALLIGGALIVRSQTAGSPSRALIHEKIDENKLVTLAGNTRPEANADNDAGEVSDSLAMDHMMLQLKRSPRQEQAAARFADDLHDPKSPNFHKWVSAEEFGKSFGLADSDVAAITGWLQSHGFTVNSVYPSRMVIDFSGDAGQVRSAFHTSIHNLTVDGVHHIANFSDPQIPEALAPAVAGIISLHDFRPHRMARVANYSYIYDRQTYEEVAPPDLATIYDFNPLFSSGITGTGQTIVVIEDSDYYSRSDWTTFRNTFGLGQYSGTLTQQHPPAPSGSNNCALPGVNGDDFEVAVDIEWASAAAPSATIVEAACADTTSFTAGLFIAMQNLVNSSAPPAIMSLSYGICEAFNGASYNAAISSLYQQAVAEGTSIFVAAGDEGAASCDAGGFVATHGIGVDGWAATAYNVAVGGTDFSDVFNGTVSTYWNPPSKNTSTYGSALSYIPEIPWNDSCAGTLISTHMGFPTGYGANGFCNSVAGQALWAVAAGSGGPSNCASGAPAPLTAGVASGTCEGYPKPSWQTGLSGIPSDGVRDIPDVAMFASDGSVWGHSSIICFSDLSNDGSSCVGAPSSWTAIGGTSVAAPVMAGIQALVNQKLGGAQGNPNPVLYALAASTPNAFHSITQGDIDVNCAAPNNCYGFLGSVDYGRNGRIFGTTWAGALSASNASYAPAFGAGPSWNFATGIGSVDANNLVNAWPKP